MKTSDQPRRDPPRDYYKGAHRVITSALDHHFTSLQVRVLQAQNAQLHAGWLVEEHMLPCNKIYYCHHGNGGFTIDGVEFPLKARHVAFLPAKHRNSCWTEPKNPVAKVWIHFDARVLGLVDLFDLIPCPPPFAVPEGSEIPALLDGIVREFALDPEKTQFGMLALNGLLTTALAQILRASQSHGSTAAGGVISNAGASRGTKPRQDIILRGPEDRVAHVLHHIAEHYANPLTLEDLAAVVHLHPTYFSNTFRKATGLAPMAFLQRFRIDRAKGMLASSDLPVMEIAVRVGFSDPYHFSRVFKKHTGSPPTQFQDSVRRKS